jgi:hypothetical protein
MHADISVFSVRSDIELMDIEQNHIALVGEEILDAELDAPLAAEKEWLRTRLVALIGKTRGVLGALGITLDVVDVERAACLERCELPLAAALQSANSIFVKVLRQVADDEELNWLVSVETAIKGGNVAVAVQRRIDRQVKRLSEARDELGAIPAASFLFQSVQQVLEAFEASPQVNNKSAPREVQKNNVRVQPKRVCKKTRRASSLENDSEESQHEDQVAERQQPKERELAAQPSSNASSEEDEGEDVNPDDKRLRDNDEEVEDDEVLDGAALAEELRANVLFIRNFISSFKSLESPNQLPAAPDVLLASGESGKKILNDGKELIIWLEMGDAHDLTALEHVGQLLRWWRTVTRSLILWGVLKELQARRDNTPKGKRKSIMAMYLAITAELGKRNLCRFTQFRKYAKLGELVETFPALLHQTMFSGIKEWTSDSMQLLDVLSKQLESDQSGFWQQPWAHEAEAMVEHRTNEEEARKTVAKAVKTKRLRKTFVCCDENSEERLWDCSLCKKAFHESCAGYDEGTIVDDFQVPKQLLHVRRYCEACLEKFDLTHEQVVEGIAELRDIASFLNDPKCPFVLQQVPGDGFCIFHCLEIFARMRLGFKGKRKAFCKILIEAAIREIEQARANGLDDPEVVDDGNGAGVEIEALQNLLKSKDIAKKLKEGAWENVEVEYLLLGFVKTFKCVVVVYHRVDGGVKELNNPYGDERDKERTLQVLQQVEGRHFDILSFEPGGK